MRKPPPLYRMAANTVVPLLPFFLRDPRQKEAHRARLAATDALVAWGKQRDPSRQLAWFHASSVGEGLQAEVVIKEFRRRWPDVLVIYTHFSPSASELASRLPVDWAGYLPYDRTRDMRRVLDALAPDLLVFTKADLWPTLSCAAAGRGTRVVMIAGTVERESSRLGTFVSAMIGPGYRVLSMVAAIAEPDGERLMNLGAHPAYVHITGDPRVDAAFTRAEVKIPQQWAPASARKTLIAGSTWRPDETVILTAFASLRKTAPDASVVLVPHDPTPARLAEIDTIANTLDLPHPVKLSTTDPSAPLPPILVVDSVGMLASLYRQGAFAYVGGGFGLRGIHSVLEPAAAARAVIVGPNDRGSRDVYILKMANVLRQLPKEDPADALLKLWTEWHLDPAKAAAVGVRAQNTVQDERGATRKIVHLLRYHLDG